MLYFVLEAFRKDLVILNQPELFLELNSFQFFHILFNTKLRTAELRILLKEMY